jgi:acetyl-CoA C-acetyltransferase
VCSENQVKSRNLKPWAKIVAIAETGLDPMCMGLGPIEAVTKVVSMRELSLHLNVHYPTLK